MILSLLFVVLLKTVKMMGTIALFLEYICMHTYAYCILWNAGVPKFHHANSIVLIQISPSMAKPFIDRVWALVGILPVLHIQRSIICLQSFV